ncbi:MULTISPECIES: ArsR/SmtB family transcription factor [unclassified Nocardiopsis]|uniref:ArsR/SmtB family transcription factor n=1 Tax=Nocardiopsis TaxID=2013 RepID=UPI00387AEDC1
MTQRDPTGDELVELFAALANPVRLRIIATLRGGRDYVSNLARVIGISRPLLHMHLQRLEAAGVVVGSLELSEDGKAMKYFELADLDLHLTPDLIATAAASLTAKENAGPTVKDTSPAVKGTSPTVKKNQEKQ